MLAQLKIMREVAPKEGPDTAAPPVGGNFVFEDPE
jgi:hypothetical protein